MIYRALVIVALCGACHSDPPALEVRAAPEPACTHGGWEQVAFTAVARQAGTLEVEVVDRWPLRDELDELMSPDGVRHLLTTIGHRELAAGETIDLSWAFGSAPPAAEPAPDACPWAARSHRDLTAAWADPQMCTYEVAQAGTGGSSSNLFEPSCDADRGWRPRLLRRPGPITANRGTWVWVAAWVWAPPDAKVELHAQGNAWTYSVEGMDIRTLPAWTVRAKLGDRKLSHPQRVR